MRTKATRQPSASGLTATEQFVYDDLTSQGAVVLRNGWPDFLVFSEKDEEHFGVEVKRAGYDDLREEQSVMHWHLEEAGLPVYTLRVLDGHGVVGAKRYECLRGPGMAR